MAYGTDAQPVLRAPLLAWAIMASLRENAPLQRNLDVLPLRA
jgi:hypothetical protein